MLLTSGCVVGLATDAATAAAVCGGARDRVVEHAQGAGPGRRARSPRCRSCRPRRRPLPWSAVLFCNLSHQHHAFQVLRDDWIGATAAVTAT